MLILDTAAIDATTMVAQPQGSRFIFSQSA